MNRFAYRTTGLAIQTLSNLSKAKVHLHDTKNIPSGAKIFVVNHFTRLETFILPYYLHKLVKQPMWSLASPELFVGALGRYLESVGAVSTANPHRDRLIIKNLLTNETGWIIFPEGLMVKSKKIIEKGRYMISYAGAKRPPHTGAAYLALRTEFYRRLLLQVHQRDPSFVREKLLPKFNISDPESICREGTYIVPVNVTYYPLRARMNILNKLAKRIVDDLPERVTEELMTEGSMILSGVDIDIRFGKPIEAALYLQTQAIRKDIQGVESMGYEYPLSSIRNAALKVTQRYMATIYGMTTVNHDHIFASLLKHSLRNSINTDTLLRKAYLIIAQGLSDLPIHLHNSLAKNQNHLLIGDDFGKWFDFLSVAQETGVIKKKNSLLIRIREKLSTIFDFHRVRIDNPVAVMANEVEPLKALQKKISCLSLLPDFWLRLKLYRFIRWKHERAFEEDYHRFFILGETKAKNIGRPIFFRGRSKALGIVLSHGYMAAPEEVRSLAKYLAGKGFFVYAPRLKGHGTSPEDLAIRSYKDWIRDMEEGYLMMSNLCRRVIVGGFSTGAALALELATRIDVDGVFAISTPLRLQYLRSRLAPVLDTWNRMMGKIRIENGKMEFVENKPENPHINYLRNPISGVRELERLMDHLEPKLKKITMPALVVQSQQDPVVHPKGSERIFNHLGSEDKQYVLFNFNRHGIIQGKDSKRVHRAVEEFISYVACLPGKYANKTTSRRYFKK
ncbi:MAG: alpha/beta fold hydrolase [Desulfobacteraceae bacterium]|nr:alpha/beta fold hydrolase [Desulfobacteraceae bacterium]